MESNADGVEEVVNEHARGRAGKAGDGKSSAKGGTAWFPEWGTITSEHHEADGGEESTVKPRNDGRLEHAERREGAKADGAK